MLDIMKGQPNPTYIFLRKQESAEIKRLIENGEEVEYSEKDNWIKIDKKTFNGWGRREVERLFIKKEEKLKKSSLIEIVAKYTGISSEKLNNRARDYLENIYNEITKEKQL